ncbi:hypothetical protein C8R45DRAFT_1086982 [Mycena sanguinolenta]|nr:hypothetical protein C8R45DRAFT_1086982 [Mycena sanguinolenta]
MIPIPRLETHKYQFGQGNDSPTSTLSESASFRFSDSASRSAFRATSTYTPATGTLAKKTLVRSDPSILTAFDPADRELYDLWAPQN